MKETAIERKESVFQGCLIGLLLFTSTLLILSLNGKQEQFLLVFTWLPLLLVGYLAAGILISLFHHRPRKPRKKDTYFSATVVFFLYMIVDITLIFLAAYLPEYFTLPIVANLLTLGGLWIYEYLSTLRAARELNGNLQKPRRCMLEDLPERPKNTEEFIDQILAYCSRNHIEVSIITAERPAVILMNGVYHKVDLDVWYSPGGPVYALRFEEMDV